MSRACIAQQNKLRAHSSYKSMMLSLYREKGSRRGGLSRVESTSKTQDTVGHQMVMGIMVYKG